MRFAEILFDDGVMELTLFPNNYVYIGWLKNKGKMQKQLVKDFRMAEKFIKEKGYCGWFVVSKEKFKGMHKILKKVGAVRFAIDAKNQHWFIKKI